ncbi:uncharacterized protein LOC131681792 [Topomyia yanbarensis]|uniref:uncharacterized protein LOC131681792 n=1 Tax=Topomyia yanbarensis TaxID=2498891 RepID=UPI00273C2921|nr:uncharacterized protein LOC131681792 [Topomyia yanbarensis]
MSAKLFLLMVVATAVLMVSTITPVEAQSPGAAPTFEDLVNERVAKTEQVLNLMIAGSTAPQEVRDAVLANAQEELASCVQQASMIGNQGQFYACTGWVLRNAGMALNGSASSGASSVN